MSYLLFLEISIESHCLLHLVRVSLDLKRAITDFFVNVFYVIHLESCFFPPVEQRFNVKSLLALFFVSTNS